MESGGDGKSGKDTQSAQDFTRASSVDKEYNLPSPIAEEMDSPESGDQPLPPLARPAAALAAFSARSVSLSGPLRRVSTAAAALGDPVDHRRGSYHLAGGGAGLPPIEPPSGNPRRGSVTGSFGLPVPPEWLRAQQQQEPTRRGSKGSFPQVSAGVGDAGMGSGSPLLSGGKKFSPKVMQPKDEGKRQVNEGPDPPYHGLVLVQRAFFLPHFLESFAAASLLGHATLDGREPALLPHPYLRHAPQSGRRGKKRKSSGT